MEAQATEPIPAGLVQLRDQPVLLRSTYPTGLELAAGFPALLRRHPGLDLRPDELQGDSRIHQGRRGPPPGWVATDISGRLYTATTAGHAISAVRESVEQATNALPPASHGTDAPPTMEAPKANQELTAQSAAVEFVNPPAAHHRAGLPSDRRRISVAGWPDVPESSHITERPWQRPPEQPAGIQDYSRAHGSSKPKQQPTRQRRRHNGFFMSPSGYCHTRGAFYRLDTPLDQDCWTCCGRTTKTAPGCIGSGAGKGPVLHRQSSQDESA